MRILFTAFFIPVSCILFAQNVVDVDKADGLPIAAFYTVNGTRLLM
jgi:hypothetical protein